MNGIRFTGALLLALGALPAAGILAGQEGPARAVWEPANYAADLELKDVFFVSTEVGWVSGAGGTILHTSDGGKTWTPQLGGEAGAADPAIHRLRFYDEWHGWAVQGSKLLRTTDGQSWEEVGATPVAMGDWGDYAFLSPTLGFALGSPSNPSHPDHIYRTRDGGRTWEPVARCQIKATIDGLVQQAGCALTRLHFPTPTVGYAIAREGMCPTCALPVVAKTVDGGETWTFALGPGDVKRALLEELFFLDERTGFVQSYENAVRKLYATSDGGATWRGVVATPGDWLRFADPEVGWAVDDSHLAYTASGGARWSSVKHGFPAEPNALSFPRRDRAYLVGDHGMIYRYRVLPEAAPVPENGVAAPAMPALASTIEREAADFEAAAGEVASALDQAPETPATPAGEAGPGFAGTCCAKRVDRLDAVLGLMAQSLPQLLARFRNTNLLQAGVRMLTALPGGLDQLKAAYAEFQQAPDKASAQAALGRLTSAAGSLHQAIRVALQEELPAPTEQAADAPAPVDVSAQAAPEAPAPEAKPAEPAGESTAQRVKKGVGGLIKKKVRIP
ncbi:MAG TPA: YCF48-related protein [Gemmatimonadales bacterium]|jgi:photosystem II stability/assembly factor-like uncharacterized protein